jgi:hypothetical protein
MERQNARLKMPFEPVSGSALAWLLRRTEPF